MKCFWHYWGEPRCANEPTHWIVNAPEGRAATSENMLAELYCEAHIAEALQPWEEGGVDDSWLVGWGRIGESWETGPLA